MATKKNKTVETSDAHYKSDEGWKFYVNDTLVTESEYIEIMDAHIKWCEEQDLAKQRKIMEAELESKKKPKKVRISKK